MTREGNQVEKNEGAALGPPPTLSLLPLWKHVTPTFIVVHLCSLKGCTKIRSCVLPFSVHFGLNWTEGRDQLPENKSDLIVAWMGENKSV